VQLEELVCPNCKAALPPEVASAQQIECKSCGSTFVRATSEDLADDQPVTCPECGTINSADKRYCTSCGELLKIDCVLCHTANKVGTVHCVNCGAHLQHARAKRKRMQEKKRKLQQERLERLKEKKERQQTEKLQLLLDDLDEPENHDFAIYQINQMGTDAIEALIETLLNDTDPDARYGSARALGQICSQHKVKGLIKARAAKALIEALQDNEPAVRYWSVDALGKCKSHTAVEPLVDIFKDDPHEGVRNHARYALESVGGKRVDNILAEDKPAGFLGWIKRN
jgi:hypothetical protein